MPRLWLDNSRTLWRRQMEMLSLWDSYGGEARMTMLKEFNPDTPIKSEGVRDLLANECLNDIPDDKRVELCVCGHSQDDHEGGERGCLKCKPKKEGAWLCQQKPCEKFTFGKWVVRL